MIASEPLLYRARVAQRRRHGASDGVHPCHLVLYRLGGERPGFFHYSDTWQLVSNTATTVLTFLAVFLIQNSQNRDGSAIQAKLDELLRAVNKARPEFIGIEHLTDKEICAIRDALEREAGTGDAGADASVGELLARRTGSG